MTVDLAAALAELDVIAAAVERLRSELSGAGQVAASDEQWLDTGAAAIRFAISKDMVRRLAREHDDIGRKIGGRHKVNAAALRRRLGIAE
ncbi:hypothetical protein [Mesorhizobium sp. 131-2-1]|uniref:hypothetical protein n=1 Tax=Mesorhizobium sp. 131-2-1 TaxID=2744518 RepID=UPI001928BD8F|nr:hypothetical protein [Mesorhizobium sp. 131-2-1]BCG94371.1 hypothetical protein MesoLj131a_32350 [Mesorhizobium sp. 131-2-1]